MHLLLDGTGRNEETVRHTFELHHAQVVFAGVDGELSRFLREDDAFFQHGRDVVLTVVMLHFIKLGLCVEFIDKETVEGRGRGDHERIDALEFGVELEGAFNGLAFIGLTLIEDYTYEDVVFGYLGVLCRLVEIRHPHGVAAVTAVVLC